ncbi:O-antigen ligase family protein [Clostridium sp. BL-8]|uniref:O-antigen ligase family protein n=1 Tax=Clostridium sp. BL-8 TaxID=349938 RepID=UPI00098C680F|nr:O-antigen ligase family protein [Clostridium sp. BL-8]OOM68383.1 O-antigen ligase [Clostridium sp. BL-8]
MENKKSYFKEKPIFFILTSIILTIVPLIVRVRGVLLDEDTTKLYGNSTQFDLFSQWKSKYLLCFSILLIIISIIFFKKIFKKKDKVINLILIGVAVFWIFTLLSAIFSAHQLYAFWGAFDRAEGIVTITCYMVLLIYSIYTFQTANNYKYLLIPIIILVVIESFLGVFQYIGHDLINSKLGLLLVTGDVNKKLNLMYDKGKLYGTLYHYDYMGSFAAIILPLLAVLTIFEKKLIYKIGLGICSLLSIWLLFGSSSRAGLVGVAFSFIFALILFGRSLSKNWKPILIGLAALLVLAIGLNAATKGAIFERAPLFLSDASLLFNDTSNFDPSNSTPVKDIKYVDGHSEVVLPNDTIKISFENNNYVFKNSKDEVISYSENNKVFTTNDPAFKNISFRYTKNSGRKAGFIYLSLNDQGIFGFSLGHDNTVHLIDPKTNQDIDLDHPEVAKFLIGKEKLGSSRGYIWSRSIPLIKNNLILGSGPDTFPFQFPQNDFIGKYYAYDTPNIFVDKPHDLYLQIALDYGVIALIAFLAIMFIYLFDCIKLYAFKASYTHSEILGVANSLGIIGYLFAGFFNDSLISVAPIFWIVFGTGIAINYINRTAIKKHSKNI